MDTRINTADEPSTSDKNLVNFGPVNLSSAGALEPNDLHAGLRNTLFATHFGLIVLPIWRL